MSFLTPRNVERAGCGRGRGRGGKPLGRQAVRGQAEAFPGFQPNLQREGAHVSGPAQTAPRRPGPRAAAGAPGMPRTWAGPAHGGSLPPAGPPSLPQGTERPAAAERGAPEAAPQPRPGAGCSLGSRLPAPPRSPGPPWPCPRWGAARAESAEGSGAAVSASEPRIRAFAEPRKCQKPRPPVPRRAGPRPAAGSPVRGPGGAQPGRLPRLLLWQRLLSAPARGCQAVTDPRRVQRT